MIRIGCVNAGSALRKRMHVDFRTSLEDALAKVDDTMDTLGRLVAKAADAGCDLVVLPEDCLCTSAWESGNPDCVSDLLAPAVDRMLERFGSLAASRRIYVVPSNDRVDENGEVRNSAFLIGRDGNEIGRYNKVCLPVQESLKTPGDAFPVFDTPNAGRVGMLICYDMVFPEASRCLALNGADLILNPTVGGAAFGSAELSRAAFRTRAVENFTPIAVSWGGWGADSGSVIISATGDIIAETMTAGEIAIADVDPHGGRECADWSNAQTDMRARIFAERNPETFRVIGDPDPPALSHLPDPEPGPPRRIAEIVRRATTYGYVEYERAQALFESGDTERAADAFKQLIVDYPNTWFDRTAKERLQALGAEH